MKKPLLAMLLVLPLLTAAQQKTSKQSIAKQSTTDVYSSPLSLQIEVGTQGLGADLRYGAFKRLSFRVGASFIPVTYNNALTLPGFQSTNNATVNFYNAHLLADVVPFKGMRGLRIVAGAAYLYKADAVLNVIPTGSYTYGSTTVTSTDIGTLNMDVSAKCVAPYLGLGLFRSFPSQFFNFNLDLGVYYISQPQTHIIGTGLLSSNDQLETQFNENLKGDRWLPVLQLNFNFRLH